MPQKHPSAANRRMKQVTSTMAVEDAAPVYQPLEKFPRAVKPLLETVTPPDETSTDYISIVPTYQATLTEVSGSKAVNALTEVSISGFTIVWGQSNKQLNAFLNRPQLRELRISADHLIISRPLQLPGVNVTIHAYRVTFEKEGAIITTPENWPELPDASGGIADGKAGKPAGNISLFASIVSADGDPSVPRFDLTGGRGQKGNRGVTPGGIVDMSGTRMEEHQLRISWSNKQAKKFKRDFDQIRTEKVIYGGDWYEFGGTNVVYWECNYATGGGQYTHPTVHHPQAGVRSWPQDGKDALRGGKPGTGGNAGRFVSSLPQASLGTLVKLTGGESAETTPAVPGQKGGQPSPAYHQVVTTYGSFSCDFPSHETTSGKSAPACPADQERGSDGEFDCRSGRGYRWLNPLNLDTAVRYLRDRYLADRMEEFSAVEERYVTALNEYPLKEIPAEFANDFQIHKSQILEMRSRINGNLDYFGHPAGWIPLLGFEANLTIYNDEVNYGISAMYLAARIENAVRDGTLTENMLNSLTDQVQRQLVEARKDLDKATARVAELSPIVARINEDIDHFATELEALEKKLLQQAKSDLTAKRAIRGSIRILAGTLQLIPYAQPALGTVGKGMDLLAQIDVDKPIETIAKTAGVFTAYGTVELEAKKAAVEIEKEKEKNKDKGKNGPAKPPTKDEVAVSQLKSAVQLSKNLETGLTTISKSLEMFKVPDDELDRELKRIEAQSSEYQEITGKLVRLNADKEQFARDLSEAIDLLQESLNTINVSLMTTETTKDQIAKLNSLLEPKAIAYAREIGLSAARRLCEYQYNMVRAYQYRSLKPVKADYYLNKMTLSMGRILAANKNGDLTDQDLVVLRSVYEDQIREMAMETVREYNEKTELQATISVELTDEQVATLNKTGEVSLDLMEMGYWDFDIVAVRISDISDFRVKFGNIQKAVTAVLRVEHSGYSQLRSDHGTVYGFCSDERISTPSWGMTYDLVKQKRTPIKPTADSETMLKALFSKFNPNDRDFITQYRPAAWGLLKLTRNLLPAERGAIAEITSMTMKFVITYFEVKNQRAVYVHSPGNVQPVVTITPDKAGAGNGVGPVVRFYDKSAKVTVSVPKQFGRFQFLRWESGETSHTLENQSKTHLFARPIYGE